MQRRHSSTTHVSFVPPPCDELTTSDPGVIATRVKPAGHDPHAVGAGQHERPQVDVPRRDARSVAVGQVDSASVGWAMNFSGCAFSLAAKAASVACGACGPTSMP